MAQKHVLKRAETLQILNPEEFKKFLVKEELTTSQVQYPSNESFAGLREGFTDIDPFQQIEMVSFTTQISSALDGGMETARMTSLVTKSWNDSGNTFFLKLYRFIVFVILQEIVHPVSVSTP